MHGNSFEKSVESELYKHLDKISYFKKNFGDANNKHLPDFIVSLYTSRALMLETKSYKTKFSIATYLKTSQGKYLQNLNHKVVGGYLLLQDLSGSRVIYRRFKIEAFEAFEMSPSKNITEALLATFKELQV